MKGNQMTYTFDADTVSDLHKDTYGFRPSDLFWEEWIGSTDAQKQTIWDGLLRALDITMERDREAERVAIERFEALVRVNISAGAEDRETALRWIMDVSSANGDWEYLCFKHGLPYQYFAVAVKA
jgi:hypothetical protein